MDKKLLRAQIMAARSRLSKDARVSAEQKVFDFVSELPEFKHATTIASFMSFRDEISMDQINRFILATGKKLLLPTIDLKSKTMTFHEVNTLSELVQNNYGILEPDPVKHPIFDIDAIDCILTPGVAFDRHGYRLGYGGGFYDRLFSHIKKTIPKIGIAFDLQRVDALPKEPYDMPIHKLVTERGIISF